MTQPDFDLILAGGGLANGLIALRLAQVRPDLRVALVEAGEHFGGNHTWSFFASDLTPAQHDWIAPLVAHRWQRYTVRFPTHSRTLHNGYYSATSPLLHAALCDVLPANCRFTGVPIVHVTPDSVTLGDQRVLSAHAVVDGRGQGGAPALDLGWQKFVGLEVELAEPHGLNDPIIMDATVDQHDGYRFVYTLPFGPTSCLIYDTYYTDGPELSAATLEQRTHAYAASQGWRIARTLRTEKGVLPIAIGGDITAHLASRAAGIAPSGMNAALFNAVTGYSLPHAVRVADLVATLPELSGATLDRAIRDHARQSWQDQAFLRVLNKMLFRGARPDERWRILDRFYKLDASLIERFYAGHTNWRDKVRILTGKPPIPIHRGLAAILRG